MEEEDEDDDLPEIEEDEIHFDEGVMVNIQEGCVYDKETPLVNEVHPKLIPLLLSMAFMLISLTLVSYTFFVQICANFGLHYFV